MKDKLSREVIEKHLMYVFGECSNNASHHGYCCPECPHYKKCTQIVFQIKAMLQPVPEEKREDIVKRYKILFHDVAESNIEPLIRKLMDELKESADEK